MTFVVILSGLILLVGYVLFDSFTSNWQGELFTSYKMTSFQMMCGVNFFSIIFCGVSLIEQGGRKMYCCCIYNILYAMNVVSDYCNYYAKVKAEIDKDLAGNDASPTMRPQPYLTS